MKKIFIAMMLCAALVSCKKDNTSNVEKENEKIEKENDEITDNTLKELDDITVGHTEAVQIVSDEDGLSPNTRVNAPAFLDFNATWCGPCQKFKPIFHAVAKKYGHLAHFLSIDADDCPQTNAAFGIEALPTLIVMPPTARKRNMWGSKTLWLTKTCSEPTYKISSNNTAKLTKHYGMRRCGKPGLRIPLVVTPTSIISFGQGTPPHYKRTDK